MQKYNFKDASLNANCDNSKFFYDETEWLGVDWIADCSTPKNTDRTIDNLMNELSTQEIEAIGRTYFNIKSRTLKRIRIPEKNGGARGPPISFDKRIYDLLAIADSIHDFASTDQEAIAILKEFGVELPKQMTVKTLNNEGDFIRFMKNHPKLEFSSGEVDNPLYGANILEQFKINKSHSDVETLSKSQARSVIGKLSNYNCNICPIDIYTDYSAGTIGKKSTESMKLQQVAQLCAAIRMFIGDKVIFEVDSFDNNLVQLIIGVSNVSEKLYNLYFASEWPSSKGVSAQLVSAIHDASIDNKNTSWVALTTDANIFDAATSSTTLEYDIRPTGKVFHSTAPYQIELMGMGTGTGTGVDVKFKDINGKSAYLTFAKNDATDNCSTRVIKYALSINSVVVSQPKSIGDHIQSFSKTLKYAIKRAGDWGQVENAKRYNKVFVTSDQLAALYAYYRRVKFIYLRRQLDSVNSICRYTFVLSR